MLREIVHFETRNYCIFSLTSRKMSQACTKQKEKTGPALNLNIRFNGDDDNEIMGVGERYESRRLPPGDGSV